MVLSIFCTFILAGNPETAFELLRIPEGFSKQLVASEPQVMDPVAFCFDDEGNILIAESFRQEQGVEDNRSSAFWLDQDLSLQTIEDRLEMYEHFADQRIHGMEYYTQYEDRIRLLKDVDGDGVYETANIFADGFNAPLDGTGAGVLALGDVVYYTCIPDLWAMQNGEKKSLHSGYGVRTALRGHDMHGLALGLDGRLYWSIGDRGYHIELDDGTVLHSPGEGAVFRSEFDGSGLEVYHHGLRNPQELAFDKYGNLFTGDNNSDSVDKARLVYCVEGGETGWRMEYQTLRGENERGPWVQENGWDPHAENRPAWILPAIDVIGSGPSGFVAYPGAGFSERYDDHFFMCDFRGGAEYSNVLSFAVEPDGGFEAEAAQFGQRRRAQQIIEDNDGRRGGGIVGHNAPVIMRRIEHLGFRVRFRRQIVEAVEALGKARLLMRRKGMAVGCILVAVRRFELGQHLAVGVDFAREGGRQGVALEKILILLDIVRELGARGETESLVL